MALVMGNMIGAGIFLLPSALAPYGPVSLLGWVLTGTGAVFLALVFARLGRAMPATGGPYAYSRRALGDFAGFLVAWGYWISVWIGNAAIAVAFVGYLAPLVPAVGASSFATGATAVAAIWILTGVNILGVREVGAVQVVTTVLKIIPLVVIGTLGLLYLDPANFRPFNVSGQSGFSAVTATAALTLWALLGLECATIPADDIRDPTRNIPKATVLGTLLTLAIYLAGTVAVMGVLPTDVLAESSAPFADAASRMWGPWARTAVAIGATIAGFGVLNGWILIQGQIPMAAARDGLFPAAFGRLSGRGTPVFGLVVSSGLSTLLVAMNYTRGLVGMFTFAILLATMTALIPYAFTTMSELILFVRERERFPEGSLLGPSIVAVVAFLYAFWAIAGSGRDTVFWGFLLLLAGVPVYVWIVWQREVGGRFVARRTDGVVER